MENEVLYDLVIVGGGPAGMSAALVAGRCRLRAAVINAEQPRNAVTHASHGFLTRDGIHPMEMLAIARTQLEKYPSVDYRNDAVVTVAKLGDGFDVALRSGVGLRAHQVILAGGYRDDIASAGIDGLEAVYGRSVFPCPFCDGFEHSDERIALFGAEGVEHFAPLLKMWTDDLAVFTHGRALPNDVTSALRRNGVAVYEGRIARLRSVEGKLTAIELADGSVVKRDSGFLFEDIGVRANDFASSLGVGSTENSWGMMTYEADAYGKTSVPGVFVVGDARTGFGGLQAAAAEGSGCVQHLVHALSSARWKG
ncbi:MAG: thioredoxin reductase [Myxococcota bacterium]|jgi:thioredoxin reductase